MQNNTGLERLLEQQLQRAKQAHRVDTAAVAIHGVSGRFVASATLAVSRQLSTCWFGRFVTGRYELKQGTFRVVSSLSRGGEFGE